MWNCTHLLCNRKQTNESRQNYDSKSNSCCGQIEFVLLPVYLCPLSSYSLNLNRNSCNTFMIMDFLHNRKLEKVYNSVCVCGAKGDITTFRGPSTIGWWWWRWWWWWWFKMLPPASSDFWTNLTSSIGYDYVRCNDLIWFHEIINWFQLYLLLFHRKTYLLLL